MDNKEEFIVKITEEFENYKKKQLDNEKEEIFDNAHEIVIKKFIRDYLCNDAELSEKQIEILLDHDIEDIIDVIYERYYEEKDNFFMGDALEEFIDEMLEVVEEELEQ